MKHNKIFSSGFAPTGGWQKLLFHFRPKNTNSLIGAVARVLEEEGIDLVDSTKFLGAAVAASPGVLTHRAPSESEAADMAYGREIARQIAGLDLGQTVVVRDRACVAIEAMEGTDETIERAARITEGQPLVVVKVSKPVQDMRFDVPVIGLKTIGSDAPLKCYGTQESMPDELCYLNATISSAHVANEAKIAIEAFVLPGERLLMRRWKKESRE